MPVRDRLFKYGSIAIVILLTNALTLLATYVYILKGELSAEIDEVKVLLGSVSEEVTINSSLRQNAEIKMSVITSIKNLSSESGGKLTADQITEIADVVLEKYKLYGIKPSLAISIMSAESSFDPRAVSSANAKGLMQVMDATARPYLENYGINWHAEVLFDPVTNAKVALEYLQNLHEVHMTQGLEQEDDYSMSLLRYNRSNIAMERLLQDPLGLQYTARINQVQKDIRSNGVI